MAYASKRQTVTTAQNGNPLTSAVFAIAPTQPGSLLVCCVLNFGTTASATGVSITSGVGGTGGSFAADNWTSPSNWNTISSTGINNGIWLDPSAKTGTNAITVTLTGGSGEESVLAIVQEWSGVLMDSGAADATATPLRDAAVQTTWSVGATATTAQPNELIIGTSSSFLQNSSPAVVTPGSPWTEESQVTLINGSNYNQALTLGYQVVAATGTFTYNGTKASCKSSACIGTLKLADRPPPSGTRQG